jgi:hypothetical protein
VPPVTNPTAPPTRPLRLEPLAALLVQAAVDVALAERHLSRWDPCAARLRGRRDALVQAYRAVLGLPNTVSDEKILIRARALLEGAHLPVPTA